MKIRSIRSKQLARQALLDDAVIVYREVRTPEPCNAVYDPTSPVEDFIFPAYGTGRGSRVTELPKETLDHRQVFELFHCRRDPMYFINRYCKVQHPLHGEVGFETRSHQQRVVGALEKKRKVIVKHPRQAGITAISIAYCLWKAIFHPNQTVLFACPNIHAAHEAKNRFHHMLTSLPEWIQPKIAYHNHRAQQLENGSMVRFGAFTQDLGRGMTIDLLVLDSAAYGRQDIMQEIWHNVMPCLSTRSQLLMSSTPNTDRDLFARRWYAAQCADGPLYPVSVEFSELPNHSDEFAQELQSMLGEAEFRRQYLAEFVAS